MSRALSSAANSGLSVPASPTIASVTLPPRCGPVLVISDSGSQPARQTAMSRAAAATRADLRMLDFDGDPDVGQRHDEEADHQHPGRQVDLAFEAAPRAVAAAEAPVAATDRATQAGRL